MTETKALVRLSPVLRDYTFEIPKYLQIAMQNHITKCGIEIILSVLDSHISPNKY